MSKLKFQRTKLAFEKFSSVLSKLGGDEELKNYFTEYILIVYYCEFEDKLKKIFRKILEKNSTKELSAFISNTMDHIFRRIDKKDIQQTIKYFGKEKENKFKLLMKENSSYVQKHQNFILNRHAVAHPKGSILISWKEIEDIDKIGEQMIRIVNKSLDHIS